MTRSQFYCPPKGLGLIVVVYILIQAIVWITITPDEKTSNREALDSHFHSSQKTDHEADSARNNTVIGYEQRLKTSMVNMSGLPVTMTKLAENYTIIRGLAMRTKRYCENSVTALGHHSVHMNDILLDTHYIHKVQNENVPEKDHQLNFGRGLLVLNKLCDHRDFRALISRRGRWVRNWNSYIVINDGISYHSSRFVNTFESGVVLQRFEYLNVYWTIIDLYNVYLALTLFEKHPENATIILADDHPSGNLDPVWNIFGKTLRVTEMNDRRNLFHSFIWMAHRDYDPILQTTLPIPLFSDFRKFVHTRYGCSIQVMNRCSGSLNIVLILRPDTSQSESRLRGAVRAILNSDAVIAAARANFPEHNISGIQMDKMHIAKQIQTVSETDVLIGMHGAGLGFGALLQPGSALVEIFPNRYRKASNNHMELLAKGNGAFYQAWYNNVPSLEDKFDSIQLPIETFLALVRKALHNVCFGNVKHK